jgi:hypothetical protein
MVTERRLAEAKRALEKAESACGAAFDRLNIVDGDLYANLNAFTTVSKDVVGDTEGLKKLRSASYAIRKLEMNLPALYELAEARRAARVRYDRLLSKGKSQQPPEALPEESPSEEE